MDFVTDRLENGRYFRILTLIDQFTREFNTCSRSGNPVSSPQGRAMPAYPA